jgi:hypothetical protein
MATSPADAPTPIAAPPRKARVPNRKAVPIKVDQNAQ